MFQSHSRVGRSVSPAAIGGMDSSRPANRKWAARGVATGKPYGRSGQRRAELTAVKTSRSADNSGPGTVRLLVVRLPDISVRNWDIAVGRLVRPVLFRRRGLGGSRLGVDHQHMDWVEQLGSFHSRA